MLSAVRLAAQAVRAEVRHDDAESAGRDLLGLPELDPVDVRVGEEPMQEHDGPPLPDLMVSELDAVG